MTLLTEIRERLNAATPGPWHLDADGDSGVYTEARASDTSSDVASAFRREDELFIAHAPTDLARLLAAVEAVEKLHQPVTHHFLTPPAGSVRVCNSCREEYPCPTIAAITAALGGVS